MFDNKKVIIPEKETKEEQTMRVVKLFLSHFSVMAIKDKGLNALKQYTTDSGCSILEILGMDNPETIKKQISSRASGGEKTLGGHISDGNKAKRLMAILISRSCYTDTDFECILDYICVPLVVYGVDDIENAKRFLKENTILVLIRFMEMIDDSNTKN